MNTDAIIYVVDSNDRERLALSKEELMAMLEARDFSFCFASAYIAARQEEELKDAALLIFANKQDIPGAMTAAEVSEGLGLGSLKSRQWHICKTSAVKGEGLQAGLDWFDQLF